MSKNKQTYIQKSKQKNQINKRAILIVGSLVAAFIITISVLVILGK